jgi:hypothetical protein
MPQLEERARASVSRASGTLADGSAPSAVEYAIIAVLIAAVAVGTWKTFGEGPQPDASSEPAAP